MKGCLRLEKAVCVASATATAAAAATTTRCEVESEAAAKTAVPQSSRSLQELTLLAKVEKRDINRSGRCATTIRCPVKWGLW